ncbi:MAG: DUF2330 domain-containing protein [Polyangiales bacterium]
MKWAALAVAGLGAAAVAWAPAPASACGGFFCSRTNPVNQAAEQIIFSKNGDGTVTAIIQIMYEGPSTKFAWVLPVSGTPKVNVSSDPALATLKQLTNPQYNLQTTFDGSCTFGPSMGAFAPGTALGAGTGGTTGGGVTVQASGAVGPYDYTVISVDPMLADPAQTAVDWLTMNGYDVGDASKVLGPYLKNGSNLLSIKLTKGATTGSIRPIMLEFGTGLPAIPIQPTAVAANDDMGVLVWVLADKRAIPQNYKALELNEALINWFNANSNYNQVVTQAAHEAMGQGFVTEYADKVATLTSTTGLSIFPSSQQQQWDDFQAAPHTDAATMIRDATNNWGSWDGFTDALTASVTLPSTIALTDFQRCVTCYISAPGVTFDTSKFLTQLYEMVIKPMADTQALLESQPYITRLYTTMSPADMTLDPAFDFNADLDTVSNIHTAKQTISCPTAGNTSSMPWRVELAQGDVVQGDMPNVWPVQIGDLPAALKILQYGTSGPGKVVDDRTAMVTAMLKQSGTMTSSSGGTSGGTGGKTGTGGTGGTGGSGGTHSSGGAGISGTDAGSGSGTGGTGGTSGAKKSSGGCSVAGSQPSDSLWLFAFALGALFYRRRR